MSKKAGDKKPSKKSAPPAVEVAPSSTGTIEAGQATDVVEVQRGPGQPSKYTPELVAEICDRLSQGEPMAQICRDEHMPNRETVRRWVEADSAIKRHIAQAREDGEYAIAADCLNIADDNGRDRRILESGVEVTDTDVVQRAKLRIDTRLKLLAKWNPKKWGEKVDVTSDGERLGNTRVIRPASPDG